MIYEKITKELNDYLGDDFILSYANNLDMDWKSILPNLQDKTAYGVLKVDSGTTTQLADQQVRLEQLTLYVAMPARRDIFDKDVANLRSMINAMNKYVVADDEANAMLLFGEYQDSQKQRVNGTDWWIASVVFVANFYTSMYLAADATITIGTSELKGLFKIDYTREFVIDPMVSTNNAMPKNKVNSIRKTLMLSGVCLKTDTVISTLFSEEDTIKTYSVSYNDGIQSRSLTALLALINEQLIMGDVIKVALTFVETQ